MKPEEQFSALYQFLAGCFHQDWAEDDPDDVTVTRRYAREATASDIGRVVREIEEYLSLPSEGEGQRHVLLADFHCYYFAPADGLSDEEWLRRVQNELRCYQNLE